MIVLHFSFLILQKKKTCLKVEQIHSMKTRQAWRKGHSLLYKHSWPKSIKTKRQWARI